MPRVLIIDDDENICQILKDYFEYEGFEAITAFDGEEGLEKVQNEDPDLIILDLMLPKIDGWELCQQLRPDNDIPIIILSAKTKNTDRIVGLEIGADDYVVKPFSPKEIVARAKAVLRRTEHPDSQKASYSYPGLDLNLDKREAIADGDKVALTPKEFDLLWCLASSPQQVFSREDLLQRIWGYDFLGDTRTVDTHIKSLRNKLGPPSRDYIQTVWGVGYKFEVNSD